MKIPKIYSQDIIKHCGNSNYDKGESYTNSVSRLYQQHDTLYANCRGSELYKVSCKFNESSIVGSSCTCYAFDDNGICKHVAAILIVWENTPEKFEDRSSFEELLRNKTKDELIKVLLDLSKKSQTFSNILYRVITPNSNIEFCENCDEALDENHEDCTYY
jgi:uncharacterized Zn finger protein